jgi:hypothetical protein
MPQKRKQQPKEKNIIVQDRSKGASRRPQPTALGEEDFGEGISDQVEGCQRRE